MNVEMIKKRVENLEERAKSIDLEAVKVVEWKPGEPKPHVEGARVVIYVSNDIPDEYKTGDPYREAV